MKTRLAIFTVLLALFALLGVMAAMAGTPSAPDVVPSYTGLVSGIYAGADGGEVFKSTNNGSSWSSIGTPGTTVEWLLVWGGALYGLSYDGIYRYDGSSWTTPLAFDTDEEGGWALGLCGVGLCATSTDNNCVPDGANPGCYSTIYRTIDGVNWPSVGTIACLEPGEKGIHTTGSGYMISGDYCNAIADGVGDYGYGSEIYTSSDGASWALAGTLPYSMTVRDAAYLGGVYYGIQYVSGDKIWYTSDINSWNEDNYYTAGTADAYFVNEGTTALWVNESGIGAFTDYYRTTDGSTYSSMIALGANYIPGQVFFGANYSWTAFNVFGAGTGGIYRSSNGTTWGEVFDGDFYSVVDYVEVEPTATPTRTPTPYPVWVSEVHGAAEVSTPCVDWNLRSRCGANDDFIEVSIGNPAIATPRAITGWTLEAGTCIYTFESDNLTGPVKVIYADDMLLMTSTPIPTPISGTSTPTRTATPTRTPTRTPTATPTPT